MERASRSFVKQVPGGHFLCDVNARNPLLPKIRAKVAFTFFHVLRDVNARNPLAALRLFFRMLQKRATSTHETNFFSISWFAVFSLVCLVPPVLVIGPRVAHITVILAPFWPQVGAAGCHFLCDVNAFLALSPGICFQFALVVVACPCVVEVHFYATSTHYHRIRVRIRDRKGGSEGPSWGLVGAIPGLSWHKCRYTYKYRYQHEHKYK